MFGVVPLLGASAESPCIRSEFEQKLVIQSHFKENIIHAHATLKHQPSDDASDGGGRRRARTVPGRAYTRDTHGRRTRALKY